MSTPTRFVVDAGGSLTKVLISPATGEVQSLTLPSINPSAVGLAADESFRELIGHLRKAIGSGQAVGWLASSAIDPGCIDQERERLVRLIGNDRLTFPVILSNDVVPLLWSLPAMSGRGVVLVCATGSGYLGGDGAGRVVRAGGCEYLGSDEGSAFDLGLSGLRSAIRATDGRGPKTVLADLLAQRTGCPPERLARRFAMAPFPKQSVAALAPCVCEAWVGGDAVAANLVSHAVDELVLGVRAVVNRLGLAVGFTVAAIGGVLHGCRPLFALLSSRLRTEAEAGLVELLPDVPRAILAALTSLLDEAGRPLLPAGIVAQHAWMLEP